MKQIHMVLIYSLTLFACDQETQPVEASAAGSSSSGGSGGGSSADGGLADSGTLLSCPDGDVVVNAWPIHAEQACIDLDEGVAVGCGSPQLTDGLGPPDARFVRSCWKQSASSDLYLATVPLQNLHTGVSEWEACDQADLSLLGNSSADALAISVCGSSGICERFAGTTCSADDTCLSLPCGGKNSAYSADGCERSPGADCSSDAECAADELCAFIELQVSWACGYEPSGVCSCGGPGPLGALGGRCAKR